MIPKQQLIKWCEKNGLKWKETIKKTIGDKIKNSRERFCELIRMRDDYTCKICQRQFKNFKLPRQLANVKHPDYKSIKMVKHITIKDLDKMYVLCHSCLLLQAFKKRNITIDRHLASTRNYGNF